MAVSKQAYGILAIEDNPGDFFLIREYLEERIDTGHLLHAEDFKKAGKLLDENISSLDVILLDLSLPDKSGTELVTAILEKAGNIPVIVLTGNADVDFSIRSISYGVSDYLIKDELTTENLYKSILYSIERKKANRELRESEERFSTLFELSPQPMYVYDPAAASIIQVNQAAVDLFGYSHEEFISMHLQKLIHPDDWKMAEDWRQEVMSDNSPSSGVQIRFCSKGGEVFFMELYGRSIRLGGRNLRSVIAINITEKIQFENRLTKAIIKTQEDERYEIGSELHDNVCQILASSQMYLSMLKPLLPEDAVGMLEHAKDNTGIAIKEIRNLSHRLAPAFFDETSFEESIERLLTDFTMDPAVTIDRVVSEKIKKLPMNLELQRNLYRILQEQLRNIQKYAQATHVEIVVDVEHGGLFLQVKDNGVGFDMHAVKKGIGHANMRRRAALFGGTAEISSAPGKGCELQVRIPLRVQDEAT